MGVSGRWVGSVGGRVCGGFSGMWCWGWVSTRGTWVEVGSAGGMVRYMWGYELMWWGLWGSTERRWVRLVGDRLRWVWGICRMSVV
jgi:hypothetical protein